jgi:hypothetical protein
VKLTRRFIEITRQVHLFRKNSQWSAATTISVPIVGRPEGIYLAA